MKVQSKILIGTGVLCLVSFLNLSPVFAQCCGSDACSQCQDAAQGSIAAMADCEICKAVFQDMELISACDYSVTDTSDGVIFSLYLKKPELMPRFRSFHEADKERCGEFKAMAAEKRSKKLCTLCNEYFDLIQRGLKEETVDTRNGALGITRTSDKALLKDLHDWSARVRTMMASLENMDFAEGKTEGKGTPKFEMSEEMMAAFKSCEICKVFADQPDMMTAASCDVIMLKNGAVFTHNVFDKKNLKAYQAFSKKMMAKVEELKKLPAKEAQKKMCPMCVEFGELDHQGALMDQVDTPSGVMTVITSAKFDLVKKIHDLSNQLKSFGG